MRTLHLRTLIVVAVAGLAVLAAACGDDTGSRRVAPGSESGGGAPATDSLYSTSNQATTPGEAAKGAPAANATQASSGALDSRGGGGEAPALASTLDRKIIFTAGIDLSVKDVATSFNDVSRIAKTAGGFVEKSSFLNASDADGSRAATLTLRVPATRYEDVLAELRTMAGVKVERETSKSSEVTEQYTDLQSRLRNLEATEAQYLKLLEQAKTIQEILTVNDRLNSVRSQIEQAQGRLKVLDNLTDLATIDVSLKPFAPAKAEKEGGPKSVSEAFADAWDASLEVVRYLAAAGAVLAVAVIWLTVPALLVLAGARFARRHRESPTAS